MAVYRISYYLYRSNPIIWREIKIPSECTVQDLMAAFCLAMGISPVPGKVWDEEEQPISEMTVLKNIFENDDYLRLTTGRCVICPDEKQQEMNSLTFLYEVLEKLEENLPAPEILDGTEFHLPQNVFRAGTINEILNGLKAQQSYTLPSFGSFYRGQQDFSRKKTHNMLYSWFLPETASMLKTEYAVPLSTVLENKTLAELKYLAETHHVYARGTRKADYVAALSRELSDFDPSMIFKQMTISEYDTFRYLVLRGEIASRNQDILYEIFPVLFHYGMISFSKKQGIFLSSAIMEDYEAWYDQEKEIQFRREKCIAAAMIGCSIYYGVFSKKVCRRILDSLYPGEIPESMLDQVWGKKLESAELPDIAFKQCAEGEEPIAYDKNLFHAKEEPLYLRVLAEEYTPRLIPDKKTVEEVSRKGIRSQIHAYRELYDFMRPYAYFYSYGLSDREDLCIYAINCLRKGYSVPETSKRTVDRFRSVWGGAEVVRKNLEEVLCKLTPEIPNILYYGYSVDAARKLQIPPKAGTELNRLIREMMEAEQRAKEEEAARKKAAAEAKKRAAARTTRTTTGKRGRRV